MLGFEPWREQERIARWVATGKKRRGSVKSGHKIGKSTLAAGLALWFPVVYPRGRVILSATAGHQVRNILWPEVMRLYNSARYPLGGYLSPDPTRGWTDLPAGGGVVAANPEKPVGMAGFSAPHQLFVIDEASGYNEKFWEPIFGNMAADAKVLALGNPTETSGTFYDSFGLKSHLWENFTISSVTTPNMVSGRNVIPGMAGRTWLRELLDDHAGIQLSEDASYDEILKVVEQATDVANQLNIRVLGRFPTHGDDVVIALSLMESAARRWPDTEERGDAQIGVDPARFGDDDSTIAPRRGNKLRPIRELKNLDGPQLADKVVESAHELREDRHERIVVNVDEAGIGASCFDALAARAEDHGLELYGINSASNATDVEAFHNMRSQLHFAFRDWLREGGSLPPNQKLHAECVAPKYKMDSRNRKQVESKDEIKKRIKRSPDRFDAACLAVFRASNAEDDNGLIVV